MRVCVSVFLCVCLSVWLSAAACQHYCTDPDVTWGSGRGCLLVVHYWADLQSVDMLRCYGNLTRTRNVSEYMIVLVVCLVMAALWNRAGHYIFSLWFLCSLFFLFSALLLSFLFCTRLISAAADWISTILPQMVWP